MGTRAVGPAVRPSWRDGHGCAGLAQRHIAREALAPTDLVGDGRVMHHHPEQTFARTRSSAVSSALSCALPSVPAASQAGRQRRSTGRSTAVRHGATPPCRHPHRPNGVATVPAQSATRRERMPRGCRGPATHGWAARSHPARRPPGELLREADLEKIAADSDVPWSLRVQVGSERGQYGWLTHVRALVSPGDAAQVLLEMQRTRPHWRIGRVQVRQTRQGPDPSCGVSRRGCRYVLCLRADHIRRARDRSASGRAVLFSEQFADGYVL